MDPVKEIKEKISIDELVSEYLSLKPAGAHLKALCPFHAEKTPSFIVSPERGTFHCFGCGKHGDIFTFYQEIEGLDFKDALQRLADKAGVELKQASYRKEDKAKHERLLKIMQNAKEFYKEELRKNQEAQKYLKERALSQATIERFELGFAPDSWDSLLKYLISLSFSEAEIEEVGLIKKTEKGGCYDRFRSRIIFPIYNEKGDCVAFSGRIFGKDDPAKYINSPETPIYHKSDILYGYHLAKEAIRKLDFSVLVEGQADLLAMHQSGFKNSLALSGTALSERQISLLKRFSKNIVLALDSDEAGVSAMIKNSKALLSFGFNIKVMALSEGKDPADILKESGSDAIKKLLKNAENLFDFLIKYFKNNLQKHEKYVKVLRSRTVPLLAFIDSQVERELEAKKLATALNVSPESVLQDAISKKEHSKKYESTSVSTPLKKDRKEDLNTLLKIKLFKEWLAELKRENFNEEFKNGILNRLQKIEENFTEESKAKSGSDEELIISDEDKEKIFINFDKDFLETEKPKEAIEAFSKNIELKFYKYQLRKISQKIKENELSGKDKEAEDLIRKARNLAEKINNLSL